jgi:hypothetical protein
MGEGFKAGSDLPTLLSNCTSFFLGYRFFFGILYWLGLPFTAPVGGPTASTSFLVLFYFIFGPAHVPYGVATTASIDFSVSAQDHSAGRERLFVMPPVLFFLLCSFRRNGIDLA